LVRLKTWNRVARTVVRGVAKPEAAETHRSLTRSSMNWSR
jgi:hypothetical protein